MPRTRPSKRIVLITLIAFVVTAATGLTLAACKGASAAGQQQQQDVRLAGTTFTGHGSDDPRVVLYALGDHIDLGVCARKDPISVSRSWSAPLVAVPGALLDGNAGCGQQVAVSNSNGTTVTATVVGRCSSCSGDDISLSPELFHQLAALGQFDGPINVSWRYTS
jgi:hypothetical protein